MTKILKGWTKFRIFKTRIKWGVTSYGDDQIKSYEFKTEKELDAFMLGVNEANGWLEYQVLPLEKTLT